jgi:hypothetical protein
MIKNLFFLCVVTFYISLPYAGYGQGLTSGGMGGMLPYLNRSIMKTMVGYFLASGPVLDIL